MTSINSSLNDCPQCGTPIASLLTEGLCPRCLLAVALTHASPGELAETMDSESAQLSRDRASPDSFKSLNQHGNEPALIGEYVLVEEIARGGMGVVYRARHQKLGREVAMKVILSGQFASANDVRRFEMEAESAAALDHPGIVPIYEIGQHQGHHFFTMKLIEGGSLAKRIPELRKDLRAFVAIVAQVAEAIDYAHRRGILHRDIKPANILLDNNSQPLVTDLGLAKRTETDSDLTGTGAIVGTPAYMPPEQATASKEITTSADVYAIGAVLYEGLTGRPPHQGDSPLATLMLAAKGEVQPPCSFNRQLDRSLELVCMKCLSREPNERYPSPGLLAEDLRRWLAGESVSVRPKSFVSVFGDLVSHQLRSAIGAMLIGIVGGLLTALPIYTNIATSLFSEQGSAFNLTELRAQLPSLALRESWWLHPPAWLGKQGLLLGFSISLFLGLAIEKVVRPKDTRQAIAVGLVAGLLMTIVQFGMYGIAASWQTHKLANSSRINSMARASLLSEPQRQDAVEHLLAEYPDLRSAEPNHRAELLGKVVSTQMMLAAPSSFLGTLGVCLTFSIIYCLAGTVHANQLSNAKVAWFSKLVRYLEVMVLLSGAMVTTVFVLLFTFGMIVNEHGAIPVPAQLIVILAIWIASTIPGWKMMQWYIRWPIYIICVVAALNLAGSVASGIK